MNHFFLVDAQIINMALQCIKLPANGLRWLIYVNITHNNLKIEFLKIINEKKRNIKIKIIILFV